MLPPTSRRPAGPLAYRDVDRLSDRVAAGLAGRGIGPGDVVALVLPPGPEYLVAYLAAAKVGAITTGVNDKLAAAERDAILDIARPRARARRARARAGIRRRPRSRSNRPRRPTTCCAGSRPTATSPSSPPDPDAPGRDHLHVGHHRAAEGRALHRPPARVHHRDRRRRPVGRRRPQLHRHLVRAPRVHDEAAGQPHARRHHVHHATVARARRAASSSPASAWRRVAGVPTQLALMLADDDFDTFDLDERAATSSSAAVRSPPGSPPRRAPGSAPRSPPATRAPRPGSGSAPRSTIPTRTRSSASAGRTRASTSRCSTRTTRRSPAGEIGRVCLRSPAVMAGYWRDPEGTRGRVHRDGPRAHRRPRVDRRPAAGCGSSGRSKEMYVRGGYNVYPVEVEAVLSTHPGLRAVAVVPRPDPVMGEIGVAVVVPPTATAADARRAPRRSREDRLARYKLPEAIARRRRAPAHRGREARPARPRGACSPRHPRPVGRVRRPWSSTSTPTRRTCATRSARSSPPSARSRSSATIVEARIAGGTADADALQAHMVELGWPALAVPDAAGGLGLGPIELALLAEELGRALAPGPLFATVTQYVPGRRGARRRPSRPSRCSRPSPTATVAGTVAIAEPTGAVDPAATTVTATPRGDGWELARREGHRVRADARRHGGGRGPRRRAPRATTASARSSSRSPRAR